MKYVLTKWFYLQNYSFSVRYVPGKKLLFADTSSRASYKEQNFEVNETNIEAQIVLINFCNVSPKNVRSIQVETEKDATLQKLLKVIKSKWPKKRDDLDESTKLYWKFQGDLVEGDGVIFKGNQIVITSCLKRNIMERLHYSHMGIDKTLARARKLVFWPIISKEIIAKIQSCPVCLKFQNSNQEMTLVNR